MKFAQRDYLIRLLNRPKKVLESNCTSGVILIMLSSLFSSSTSSFFVIRL
jgi:hypothetical protein